MDVNYQEDDTSISPPWKFLDTEFIQKLSDLANPKTAYLTFNILYYTEDAKKRVFENFNLVKNIECSRIIEIEDGNNRVVMLARNNGIPFSKVVDDPLSNSKILENMLKVWKVDNKGAWMNDMGMSDHIGEIQELKYKAAIVKK